MRAKKSLGQHFLTDPRSVEKIIRAIPVTPDIPIVEIGPGKGVLTAALLRNGFTVNAIEKDSDMIPILTERFAEEITQGKLTLCEGDGLTVPFPKTPYAIVANIPYYITGALIERFLTEAIQPIALVLLVQKEVAQRAIDTKESIFSLSIQCYGTPSIKGIIKKGAFYPVPKVDSAILVVTNISRKQFISKKHEALFFSVVKTSFNQKRKQVKPLLLQQGIPEEKIQSWMTEYGIRIDARAERIPLHAWIALTK